LWMVAGQNKESESSCCDGRTIAALTSIDLIRSFGIGVQPPSIGTPRRLGSAVSL
jgi:hypothetical protein